MAKFNSVKRVCTIIACIFSLTFAYANGSIETCDTSITKKVTVLYRTDKSDIDESYRDNKARTDSIRSILDTPPHRIDSIIILSWASPDGSYTHNSDLAAERNIKARDYLLKEYPELDPDLIILKPGTENWTHLSEIVQERYSRPDKEKVLSIIYDTSVGVETRKWRLKRLDEGRTWNFLLHNYMPFLRASTYIFIYTEEVEPEIPAIAEPEPEPEPIPVPVPEEAVTAPVDTAEVIIIQPEVTPVPVSPRRTIFAMRTNLLVPLLNFGAEVPIGNNWSVGADYYFPWMKRNSHNKECFQLLGWSLEGRYWFGKNRTDADRLKGHSLGLSTMIGYYDFEKNYAGQQGEFANISVDYLFALPLFKDRISLEFTAGIGYFLTMGRPYDVFEDGGKAYRKGYSKRDHWIGPNKIGVSLVVPIKAKRRSER